jgi:predicted methyltransferase
MKKILLIPLSLMIMGPALHQAAYSAEDDRLDEILAARPERAQARYKYRRPRETLEFFGIEPGMTVVEVNPGNGWYTRILLPYLGNEGRLIGADYSLEMWPHFPFANKKFLEQKKTWIQDFEAGAKKQRTGNDAEASAFVLGSLPESMHGTADVVMFVRALHNLARFASEGDYLGEAIRDAYDVLKPGGVVGVVQHHARDDMPDSWASGSNGYLKKGFVIERMEAAGFELVADSGLNANPKDQPTTEDVVWRLPPGYRGSGNDPEFKAKMDAIGESNRMTLKFRKP